MGKRKTYSLEYKKEIIRLITEQGKKVKDVAKDINVSETSIRRWIKQYSKHGDDAFPGKGKLREEDEEIRKLKKQLADIKKVAT
ncbi:MAG: transposase [Clostridia bacterium]|nr:transposase [Clostridia bacterium]